MNIGVNIFITPYTIGIVPLAQQLEKMGFESLFVPEHPVLPVHRTVAWPGGGELPDWYKRTIDPFVGLMAAAASTKKLRVGTGICLVPQRHPLIMAKQVATLDYISGGRFEFGVGAGWLTDEMKLFGVDIAHPWAQVKDFIQAMKKLWTEDEAAYTGKYIQFPAVHCDPKPIQKPHPPILIAGEGPKVADRVAGYGDGWFPRGRGMDGKQLEEGIKKINAAWRAKGRTGRPTVSVFGAPADKVKIKEFFSAGADRVIVGLPSEDEAKITERLKKLAGDVL